MIAPFERITTPWVTKEVVEKHLLSLVEALKDMERGRCYAVLLGPDGVQCLTVEEYDALSEASWQRSDGPAEIEQMARKLSDKLTGIQAEKQARSRQPREN